MVEQLTDKTKDYPLYRVAQARSGDKGDTCDISVFAPDEESFRLLLDELSAERVKLHFGAFVAGQVERYVLPKLFALKFVCHSALGGGGAGSLRADNLGKSMAANLLRMEIKFPVEVAERSPLFQGPGGGQ